MQFVSGPGGDAFLVMHRLADLDHIIKSGRQPAPGFFDQVAARCGQDHRPGLDPIGIGMSLGVAHRRLHTRDEIGGVPIAGRGIGV